ncbi:hypothetical protein TRFO_08964 [Tritrichomonas foetus]|uniref:Uncharacterized protein n=1 Tax=Tritrichomonas foetus TaxID=1144522 RepID=A0A1J4JGT4_9EUKA|nr:hypothetical protein TRFO_08964 [Tritrichomonas foetus]|eukprot:OHS98368.1 hypothetical protein TRFO_08964 [Tritrichomonas foetus]
MNDQEFFTRFSNYLEDGLPEEILRDKTIVQRILNTMMGENPQLNFNILSILRAWCRKMEIRIRIENDNRILMNSGTDLRDAVSPFCIQFAISASTFFKNGSLLPLACITCQELLSLGRIPTPQVVVDRALEQIHNKAVEIPLLELISNSENPVQNLPIYDPIVLFNHPTLHRQLLALSAKDDVMKFNEIKNCYSEIQQINKGEIDVNRDLVQFCDVCLLFNRAPANLFAAYPHPKVRKLFYQHAIKSNLDIPQFSDVLICCGLFDQIVKKDAIKLLKKQIDSLKNGEITHSQIAHLQCIETEKASKLMDKICEFINAADDFTTICSWLRFLYHKEKWIRDQTHEYLQEMLPFKIKIDLKEQPFEDHFVKRYQYNLDRFTKCYDNPLAESLFDTLLTDEQADFIKEIAASKLIEVLLDPSQGINKYLPKLRNLSFSKYPKLMHALSIRDGDWKITSVERLFQLINSITVENSMDLLPILTRVVFRPLLIFEGNGSSLLKLPFYVEDNYDIKGKWGYVNESLYKPVNDFPYADILNDWVHYQPKPNKPIVDGLCIPSLMSLCICDKVLAADLLCQLDTEESALSKLQVIAQPPQIVYLLLICTLSAKIATKSASILCQKYIDKIPSNGMKLNQALTEFGGDCPLPSKINDYVFDPELRRAALSLITTHMQFKKDISCVNFSKIITLLEDELPINIRRQVTLMLINLPRGTISNNLTQQKDSIVRSLAFHTASLDKEHFDDAINCLFNKNEAICCRASAFEFVVSYFSSVKYIEVKKDFSSLYLEFGEIENLFSLQLIKLLSIPQIREQMISYEDYILPYLSNNSSSLFTNAALISLQGYEFSNKEFARAILSLSSNTKYIHNILLILSQLSLDKLKMFDSRIISSICDHIAEDDIDLEFTCINHLLLAQIEFPCDGIPALLSVYKSFYDPTPLHNVLSHIFITSNGCKIAALDAGFLTLARNELVMFGENYSRFRMIWRTVSCFVYDFEEGQNALLDFWSVDTLAEFFDTSDTMLKFYLCLTYRNEITQDAFSGELFELIFDEFDKTRISPPLLLRLIASILNSSNVRKLLYKQKRVQRFLPRLNYAVTHKEWNLLDGMLRILYTLSCYNDGCEELFDKNKITDLFIILLSNETVVKMPIFSALIQNLKRNSITWRALTYATRKTNIELLDKLTHLGDVGQSSRQRNM